MFQISIVSLAAALIIGTGIPGLTTSEPKVSPYAAWQMNFDGNYSSLLTSRFAADSDPQAYCVAGDSSIMSKQGDLLSSLIVDGALLTKLQAEHPYTQFVDISALKKIELAMARATQSKFGKNFYAYQVCWSEQNHVALASGVADYAVPMSMRKEPKLKQDGSPDWPNEVVIIMQNDTVSVLTDIPLFGKTLTGAESSACKADLKTSAIDWSCFETSSIKDPDATKDVNTFKVWTIPLQNKVIDPTTVLTKTVNVPF